MLFSAFAGIVTAVRAGDGVGAAADMLDGLRGTQDAWEAEASLARPSDEAL